MLQSQQRRKTAFVILCIACIAGIAIYGWIVTRSRRIPAPVVTPRPSAETSGGPAAQPPAAITEEHPATTPEKPTTGRKSESVRHPSPAAAPPQAEAKPARLYFESNALGLNYGKAAVAPLSDIAQRRYADLSCDRLYFSGGNGVCLHADRGMFTKYWAIGFDDQFRQRWSFQLNGLPSRVRVSPSGRLAAITIFLVGQSYTSLNFATQTMILNAATGQPLVDNLEQFAVTRNGAEFKSKDFNFWGVTFARDENVFYATLWSKATTYLIEGDLAKRTAKVIHDVVECPSLSPDNTRIAFKKRAPGPRVVWRLTVLDVKSGQETPVGETRSVDDQVEWLDNDHLLYAQSESENGSSASTDLWTIPATADGTPQLLLQGAFSPAVTR